MFVETFIAAFALGALIGFACTTVFVVDGLRRSRNSLRNRIIEEQMRTYAAQARLAAFRLMAAKRGDLADNDRHSRKAALEVVK